MKKSVYLLMMFLGLAFTSCEPMEDIHDEVDAEIANREIAGNIDYTMVEEDYTADPEDGGLGLNYPNFNSVTDAQNLIPEFLAMEFPVWGEGSIANVTFDIYAPVTYPKEVISYEVTTEDYDSYEETAKYNNFDSMSQIYTFLNDKYPDVENRTLVVLSYVYYDGQTNDLVNGFLYNDGQWKLIPGITEDEYNMMGESYPNFSSTDEAEAKLPVFLLDKYKYQDLSAGTVKPVFYQWYSGGIHNEVAYFVYDGTSWSLYDNLVSQTAQFGYTDGHWETDNTIQYTLVPADYAYIGSVFEDTYPDPAWSVGNYNNFDRREGNRNQWDDDMILEAMNALLNGKVAPDAAEGQKFVMTFAIYNGNAGTESVALIKENGVWVRQ